jgi:hypothetical protein
LEEKTMFRLSVAFALAALVTTPAVAGPCKDAKGKFMKCPTAPAVTKLANGRCQVASGPKKGQFTKCP